MNGLNEKKSRQSNSLCGTSTHSPFAISICPAMLFARFPTAPYYIRNDDVRNVRLQRLNVTVPARRSFFARRAHTFHSILPHCIAWISILLDSIHVPLRETQLQRPVACFSTLCAVHKSVSCLSFLLSSRARWLCVCFCVWESRNSSVRIKCQQMFGKARTSQASVSTHNTVLYYTYNWRFWRRAERNTAASTLCWHYCRSAWQSIKLRACRHIALVLTRFEFERHGDEFIV